ncbi:MAG TPA: methyltransferase domain-containing protein [Candidatus Acidoferrum sp.]|nr:methyltransferase domain-containing protein [Candidatus Acidoferrum sp.]
MGPSTLINRLLAPLGIKLSRGHPPDDNRAMYETLYSPQSLRDRRFYNVGAGSFRHPFWTNVDTPSDWYSAERRHNIDIKWDMSSLSPLGVDDGVAEIVYCSHVIEHLLNEHVRHFFGEAYRILKPGGTIRITCPDLLLVYEGYRRRNRFLLPREEETFSLQDRFMNFFATQLTDIMRLNNPHGASATKLADAEVDRLFATLPFDAACDHITALCNFDLQHKVPGAHINWWHFDKIGGFLRAAGFRTVRRSGYCQSLCPVMRNPAYFDNTVPQFSVYVEAEK